MGYELCIMEAEVIDESSDPFGFSVRVRLTSPTGVSDGEEEMSSNEETPLSLTGTEQISEDGAQEMKEFVGETLSNNAPPDTPTTEEESGDRTALLSTEDSVPLPSEMEKHTSSIGGAIFNFINSIIGSGIIGIPLALHQAGFASGVLLLGVVAVITDYTVLLLIKDGLISGKFSYQEMVTKAFRTPGYIFLTVAQLLFPFFAMAGYVVVTGDTFSRVVTQIFAFADSEPIPILVDSRLIKVVVVLALMLPLSLLRNISKLELFSGVAILCIIFIVSVTLYEAAHLYCAVRCLQPECCQAPVTAWGINKGIVEAVGVMAAAFVCHHNTYLIYASLHKRSLTRFAIVTHVSVSTSYVFCVILGLAGFLTFIAETQGDLLNNYCVDDPIAIAARLCFACVIILTYPIECFVAREVLEIALSKLPYKTISWIPVYHIRKAFDRFLYSPRHKSLSRHIVLTVILVVSTLGVGLSTNDLGLVLTFNGCFTAIPLAFILPTASYLKLSGSRWCSKDKIIAFVVMVFGIIVMFIGTGLAVAEAVESYSHQEEYVPYYCTDTEYDRCCKLFQATRNFTTESVTLCDCRHICSNFSVLENNRSNGTILGNIDTCVL